MIEATEAIELAHADIEHAQDAIALATDGLAGARADLASAKQAFVASPSPDGDAAVELAESNVRSAERLVEARTFGLRSVEELLSAAERLKAEHELETAGESREQLRRELKAKLDKLRDYYNEASQVVAELESLVSRDQQICLAASDAQRRANVAGSIRPIELDTLLRAAQQLLAAGRPRPRSEAMRDTSMDRVLAELTAQPTVVSADDKAVVLELALTEHARVAEGGGSLGIWMTPCFSPLPQFLKGTPSAARHVQAAQLLAALQGDPQ